jgi:hypothetical protein
VVAAASSSSSSGAAAGRSRQRPQLRGMPAIDPPCRHIRSHAPLRH